MKKALLGMGISFFIVLCAAIALPFFIDVDQYRPELVKQINSHIHGEAKLEKLRLNLWGILKVELIGFEIRDQRQEEVLSAADAAVVFPWMSLIKGKPEMVFRLDKPSIVLRKLGDASWNLSNLAKTSAGATESKESPGGSQSPDQVKVPEIARKATLSLEVRDAQLRVMDPSQKLDHRFERLNLSIKNIGLSTPITLEFETAQDTRLASGMELKGEVRAGAKITNEFQDLWLQKANVDFNVDAAGLSITVPGKFVKKSGIPLSFSGQVFLERGDTPAVPKQSIQLVDGEFKFHTLAMKLGAELPLPQVMNLDFSSNEIALNDWKSFIPSMEGFDLEGKMSLSGHAKQNGSKNNLDLHLLGVGLSGKHPLLKQKPSLDFDLKLKESGIESLQARFVAGKSDLSLMNSAQIVDAKAKSAAVLVRLDSKNGLNFDEMFHLPPETKEQEATANDAQPVAEASAAPVVDQDAKVAVSVQSNPWLQGLKFQFLGKIPTIQYRDRRLTRFEVDFLFHDLTAQLKTFAFELFDGAFHMAGTVRLTGVQPSYQLDVGVKSMNLKKAIASNIKSFQNTAHGLLSFEMKGSGQSFNTDVAMANADFRGQLTIQQPVLQTIEIGEWINKSTEAVMQKVTAKVPQLQGKSLPKVAGGEASMESLMGSFQIARSEFRMDNFVLKSKPGKNADVRGNLLLKLTGDRALSGKWILVDQYNLTKLKDISIAVDGTTVPNLLSEDPSKPVEFPIAVSCTMSKPCWKAETTGEHFVTIALENIRKAAEQRLKGEAKKLADAAARQAAEAARQAAEKVVPKSVAPKVEAIKKKLFGY